MLSYQRKVFSHYSMIYFEVNGQNFKVASKLQGAVQPLSSARCTVLAGLCCSYLQLQRLAIWTKPQWCSFIFIVFSCNFFCLLIRMSSKLTYISPLNTKGIPDCCWYKVLLRDRKDEDQLDSVQTSLDISATEHIFEITSTLLFLYN